MSNNLIMENNILEIKNKNNRDLFQEIREIKHRIIWQYGTIDWNIDIPNDLWMTKQILQMMLYLSEFAEEIKNK